MVFSRSSYQPSFADRPHHRKGIIVAGLAKLNLIHPIGNWTADNVEKGIQDLLICVEMLIIAIAHTSAFPSRPYEDGTTRFDGANLLEAHFAHHSAIRDFNEVKVIVPRCISSGCVLQLDGSMSSLLMESPSTNASLGVEHKLQVPGSLSEVLSESC